MPRAALEPPPRCRAGGGVYVKGGGKDRARLHRRGRRLDALVRSLDSIVWLLRGDGFGHDLGRLGGGRRVGPFRGEDVRAAGEDVGADVRHVLFGRRIAGRSRVLGSRRSLAEAGSLSLAHDATA
jgi:hypothetical protein